MTNRKIRFLLLAILLSAVFVVSGIQIYGELAARQKEKNEFEELAALVEASQPDSMPWPDMEPEDGEEAMPEPEATEPAGAEEALRDLSALFARNGDCIGWLSVPDTAVDYPVMHTPENPQKYLRRSFYGEYSVSGVPFLDSRCSLGGDNLIIYGIYRLRFSCGAWAGRTADRRRPDGVRGVRRGQDQQRGSMVCLYHS